MVFSALINRVSRLLRLKSSQTLPIITASLYRYSDIPLKLYIDISGTNDFQRLIKSGTADSFQCAEAWEAIIRENNTHSGSREYDNYFSLLKDYWTLIKEYVQVRANLVKLCMVVDYQLIVECRGMGYPINVKNSEAYAKSLGLCLRRTGNLKTKAKTILNEIELNFPKRKEGEGNNAFDDIMGQLHVEGVSGLTDDLTLSRYNSIKQTIMRRNEAKLKAHGSRT